MNSLDAVKNNILARRPAVIEAQAGIQKLNADLACIDSNLEEAKQALRDATETWEAAEAGSPAEAKAQVRMQMCERKQVQLMEDKRAVQREKALLVNQIYDAGKFDPRGLLTKRQLLARQLPAMRASSSQVNKSQTDTKKPFRPLSVSTYDELPDLVMEMMEMMEKLEDSEALFEMTRLETTKGTHRERNVDIYWGANVSENLNKVFVQDSTTIREYRWQPDSNEFTGNSQLASAQASGQALGNDLDADAVTSPLPASAGRTAGGLLQGQDPVTSPPLASPGTTGGLPSPDAGGTSGAAGISPLPTCNRASAGATVSGARHTKNITEPATFLDVALRRSKGGSRAIRAVVELKARGRLEQRDINNRVIPVDMPAVWNHKQVGVETGLQNNVEGIISQATRYCAPRGCKYCVLSNYDYTYIGVFDQAGNLRISRGIPYNSMQPTVLQTMYFVAIKAAAEHLEPWRAEREHIINRQPRAAYCGPVTRKRSQEDTDDAPGSRKAAGRGKQPDVGSHRSAAGAAKPTSAGKTGGTASKRSRKHAGSGGGSGSDVAPAGDQLADAKPRWQVHSGADGAGERSTQLQAAADRFVLDSITASIAHGASGFVFTARTNAGPAAVKLARKGTGEAAMLAHEAAMYERCTDIQGKVLPEVLAAGSCLGGRSFVLATVMVPAVPLDEVPVRADVRNAAQVALGALHARGILHGDVHGSNVLVALPESGPPEVLLVDLGHAVPDASAAQLQAEVQQLAELFPGL